MRAMGRAASVTLAVVCVIGGMMVGTGLVDRLARGAAADGTQPAPTTAITQRDAMSPLFVQVAAAAKSAVVEVRVSKKVTMQDPGDMEDFLRRFFGDEGATPRQRMPRPPREFLQRGLGSGVIVDARNGYLLTNYHVVANADQTQVLMSEGQSLKVVWTRGDPMTDLAVVKVEPVKEMAALPLGDSDAMKVGEWVLAIGSPAGLPQTVTAGIISAKGRSTSSLETYQSFLQTDAAINRGNSGGPLVNMRGEVVGINAAIISESGGNEGIGFAVPSNMARSIMTQLIEKGKVTRGFLGVNIQPVDERLARSFRLPGTQGALVAGVSPDSPADKAGLKPGDFITAIDGKPIRSPNELRNAVAQQAPGSTVTIEFYRDGRKQSGKATLGTLPAAATGPAGGEGEQRTGAARYGLEVATMTPQLAQQYGFKRPVQGAVVTAVSPGSPADDEGLKEGMVITQAGDKDIATADDFRQAAAKADNQQGIRLRVVDPSGAAMFIFLAPPPK